MSLGCGLGETARSCSAGDRSPCSGSTISPARCATASHSRIVRLISAAPGKKTRVWPRCSSLSSNSTALFTCTCRTAGECGRCLIVSSNSLPSDLNIGQPSRYRATGAASSVADITTIRRSGRVRCSRFNNTSAKSLSKCRSWNSSRTTVGDALSFLHWPRCNLLLTAGPDRMCGVAVGGVPSSKVETVLALLYIGVRLVIGTIFRVYLATTKLTTWEKENGSVWPEEHTSLARHTDIMSSQDKDKV